LWHAAAFGLLAVWYLLTAPFVSSDPPGRLELNAPLSRSQMDSSDIASGCYEQRNNMVRMYQSRHEVYGAISGWFTAADWVRDQLGNTTGTI